MAVSLGEIKKMCREKGGAFRAASLFGISKNDSGKYDFTVATASAAYAVKVLTLGEGAARVYFYRDRGYFTVYGAADETDYMWVAPNFPESEGGKPCTPVLLLDGDGCDRANTMDGQTATRLDAFLEMLHSKQEALV